MKDTIITIIAEALRELIAGADSSLNSFAKGTQEQSDSLTEEVASAPSTIKDYISATKNKSISFEKEMKSSAANMNMTSSGYLSKCQERHGPHSMRLLETLGAFAPEESDNDNEARPIREWRQPSALANLEARSTLQDFRQQNGVSESSDVVFDVDANQEKAASDVSHKS